MKKLIIYCGLTALVVLNADNIDEIVTKINSQRHSTIPKDKLTTITSPMPKLVVIDDNATKDANKTLVKDKKDSFILTATMNNSAFINGNWIKVGDRINGYKLVDIMKDSVYLKDGNKTKMIFFKSDAKKIKIKIGR